jgi:hypothetical protein
MAALLEDEAVVTTKKDIDVFNIVDNTSSSSHLIVGSNLMQLLSMMTDFSPVHLMNVGLDPDGISTDIEYTLTTRCPELRIEAAEYFILLTPSHMPTSLENILWTGAQPQPWVRYDEQDLPSWAAVRKDDSEAEPRTDAETFFCYLLTEDNLKKDK